MTSAGVGQAAEDLGPVGVADQRHRDDERVRVVPAQRQRRRDDQFPPARQVLEIAVGPYPLPEHEADVLRVVYDRVRKPPVQFLPAVQMGFRSSLRNPIRSLEV
jgi:hypothetical protein